MINTTAIANLAEWARGQAIQRRLQNLQADAEGMDQLAEIADAYLATLPKEVPVECWGVILHGSPTGIYEVRCSEESIHQWAKERLAGNGYSFVKMTGVAIIPPARG